MPLLAPVPVRSISSLPSLGKGKDGGPEDRLWRELMLALWNVPIPKPTWAKHCPMRVYDKPSSRNWPPMAAATWYAADPGKAIDGRTASQWWRLWCQLQLGRCTDGPPALQMFGSDEVLSSTYDGYTVGAALAALVCARRYKDEETLSVLGSWLSAWVAVTSLAASRPSSGVRVHGLKGIQALKLPRGSNIPAVLGIGARSTPNHAVADPRGLLLAEMIKWPEAKHPWPARDPWDFWFLQVAALCEGDFGLVLQVEADARAVIEQEYYAAMDRLADLLAGTRWVGFEIRRWKGIVAGIMPECRNGNTAWVPGSVLKSGGDAILQFPWPKSKPGNLGSGRAWIDETGRLQADSGFGKVDPIVLPAEPPIRRWIFDKEFATTKPKAGKQVRGVRTGSVYGLPSP